MSGKLVLDEIDVKTVNIDTLTVSQSNLWTTQTYEFKRLADNMAFLTAKLEDLSEDIKALESSTEKSLEGIESKIKEDFIEYTEHFNVENLSAKLEDLSTGIKALESSTEKSLGNNESKNKESFIELTTKIEALTADIKALKSNKENSLEGIENKIKEDFIEYMMEHFNIKWLDDSIERDAYETILSVLFKLLNKVV